MNYSLIAQIITWLSLWFFGLGAYYIFFKPQKHSYTQNTGTLALWYFILTCFVALYWSGPIYEYFSVKTDIGVKLGLVGIMILTFFYYAHQYYRVEKAPYELPHSLSYFIVKFYEIVFTQSLFLVLLIGLSNTGESNGVVILLFVLTYAVISLPLRLFVSKKWFLNYMAVLPISGLIFAIATLYIPLGIIISFTAQVFLYDAMQFRIKNKTN